VRREGAEDDGWCGRRDGGWWGGAQEGVACVEEEGEEEEVERGEEGAVVGRGVRVGDPEGGRGMGCTYVVAMEGLAAICATRCWT
jgi:hypothetical protein